MNQKPNIVFLDSNTVGEVEGIDKIRQLGNYSEYDITSPEQRIERIKGNQVVITNKVVIDRAVMEACSELKLICITATGMNNVDLEYAAQRGIEVKNVAGYSTDSVAQTTFSLLLYLLNKSRYFDDFVKQGKYESSGLFTHHGRSFWELKGKRYGIIGLGQIGRKVAQIATAFGAEVVYYSTSGKNTSQEYEQVALDTVLKTSDVVSIHCPLNEKTNNLIDKEQLAMMKQTAILINVGRGGIVNEQALAGALDADLIAAAGFDVLVHEPIEPGNPLMTVKNKEKILVTPHIAWISQEARETLFEGVYNNIEAWMEES